MATEKTGFVFEINDGDELLFLRATFRNYLHNCGKGNGIGTGAYSDAEIINSLNAFDAFDQTDATLQRWLSDNIALLHIDSENLDTRMVSLAKIASGNTLSHLVTSSVAELMDIDKGDAIAAIVDTMRADAIVDGLSEAGYAKPVTTSDAAAAMDAAQPNDWHQFLDCLSPFAIERLRSVMASR